MNDNPPRLEISIYAAPGARFVAVARRRGEDGRGEDGRGQEQCKGSLPSVLAFMRAAALEFGRPHAFAPAGAGKPVTARGFASAATGLTSRINSEARMARIRADTLAWLSSLPADAEGWRRAPWREGAALQGIATNDLGAALFELEQAGALRRELRAVPRRGFRQTFVLLPQGAAQNQMNDAGGETAMQTATKTAGGWLAWTPQEDALLREMAAQGASSTAIGERLERSRGAVMGRAQRLGIALLSRTGCSDTKPRWSEAEDARLRELAAQGRTAAQIGAEIGRTRDAVAGRAERLEIDLLARAAPRPEKTALRDPDPAETAARMAAQLRTLAHKLQQDTLSLHLWRLADDLLVSEPAIAAAIAHLPDHRIAAREPVDRQAGWRFTLQALPPARIAAAMPNGLRP